MEIKENKKIGIANKIFVWLEKGGVSIVKLCIE